MDATVETPSPAMFIRVSITHTLREKRTDVTALCQTRLALLSQLMFFFFFSLQRCLPQLTSQWIPAQTQEISMSTGQLPKRQVNIDRVPHARWVMPSLDLGLRIGLFFFTRANISSRYFLFISHFSDS